MRAAVVLALVSAIDCGDGEPNWVRFNGDDSVDVQVTAAGDPGPATSIGLTSTTGAVALGTAVVDPDSGPVGTRHRVTVDVVDSFEDVIGKVSLRIDAGRRGTDEFDLTRDSADHGHWVIAIESVGTPGEVRTDRFSIRLWEDDETGAEPDTEGDETDTDTEIDTDTDTDTDLDSGVPPIRPPSPSWRVAPGRLPRR